MYALSFLLQCDSSNSNNEMPRRSHLSPKELDHIIGNEASNLPTRRSSPGEATTRHQHDNAGYRIIDTRRPSATSRARRTVDSTKAKTTYFPSVSRAEEERQLLPWLRYIGSATLHIVLIVTLCLVIWYYSWWAELCSLANCLAHPETLPALPTPFDCAAVLQLVDQARSGLHEIPEYLLTDEVTALSTSLLAIADHQAQLALVLPEFGISVGPTLFTLGQIPLRPRTGVTALSNTQSAAVHIANAFSLGLRTVDEFVCTAVPRATDAIQKRYNQVKVERLHDWWQINPSWSTEHQANKTLALSGLAQMSHDMTQAREALAVGYALFLDVDKHLGAIQLRLETGAYIQAQPSNASETLAFDQDVQELLVKAVGQHHLQFYTKYIEDVGRHGSWTCYWYSWAVSRIRLLKTRRLQRGSRRRQTTT